MKKRVAILVPGGVGGGLFNQGIPALVNLIEGLSIQFDITVYSMVSVSPDFKPINYKIKIVNATQQNWRIGRVIQLGIMVMKDHRKKRYDLFHGFWGIPCGTLAVVLGALFRRPSIVSLQGGEAACLPNIKYGYLLSKNRKWLLFKTMNTSSAVTSLTQFQRDKLIQAGYKGKELVVLPYGADMSIFSPTTKDYTSQIHFLHVANLTEVKDQPTMLRTFKFIRDTIPCQLKVIGFDDMNGTIQELSSELGLDQDVLFLSPMKHEALREHFSWAHILLHTSLYESQAVVVNEALASNVVVAGTRVGLIHDLQPFMISAEVGDFMQLAQKCIDAVADPNEIRSKSMKGLEWTRSNNMDATIAGFSRLYNKVVV